MVTEPVGTSASLDVVETLALSAVSLVIGALFNNWWNRGRPLLVLQGFSEVFRAAQPVSLPAEIAGVTGDSWHTAVSGSEVRLGSLHGAVQGARMNQALFQSAIDRLPNLITSLENTSDNEEFKGILQECLISRGIEVGISMSLIRSEFTIDDPETGFAVPVIPVEEVQGKTGAYRIFWKSGASDIGDEVTGFTSEALRARFAPFVKSVRFLQRESLIDALKKVIAPLDRQIRINRTIIDHGAPILEDHSRFAAKLLLANYGLAPMMIWPKAEMRINHKQSRARVTIPCYLTHEEQPGKMRDLEGVYALAPGERINLWAVSESVQAKLDQGRIVRTYFNESNASGRVTMRITRRGGIRRKASSNWAPFSSSVELPSPE